MISVMFQIVIPSLPRNYRMMVEHFYTSDQVERFRIQGKEKQMIIEKRLKESRKWKILEGAPLPKNPGDEDQLALHILNIQRSLDRYLEERDPLQTQGYFHFKSTRPGLNKNSFRR